MKKFDVLNQIASTGVVAVVRAENTEKGLKISEGKLVYETDDEEEQKILDDFGMTRESKVKFSAYING